MPFSAKQQEVVEALASQAAVAYENAELLAKQKALMDSFVQVIAGAIDDKSPYTGAHCRRVPVLAQLLTEAVCRQTEGPFAETSFSEDELESLRIAAWLHDCGKIITPVHVMDKATKLEAIHDRINDIRTRVVVLKAQLRLSALEGAGCGIERLSDSQREALEAQVTAVDEDLRFLEKYNQGGEFMKTEEQERVAAIGERRWEDCDGTEQALLTEDEIANLQIRKGTLSDDQLTTMHAHAVHTQGMLTGLPFPSYLAHVTEYAWAHHEKMNGKGYPRGAYAADLPLATRILAVADIFESLSATDRPYKNPYRLSQSMDIIGKMKQFGELDPDVVDVFVRSGVYRQYAERFLPKELIDEVDEEAILSVEPKPFETPPLQERSERLAAILPRFEQFLARDRA